MSNLSAAVFGATGAIGQAICSWFLSRDYEVVAVSRTPFKPPDSLSLARWVTWSPGDGVDTLSTCGGAPFDALVWAQGANCSDDIYTFDLDAHERLYAANVSYVLVSLQALLKAGKLAKSARLCVISSIWQDIARQNKLSYCVTKSALQGLVQSLSIDLGRSGHLVNAVLPGALDTPMTRAHLSEEQISRLEGMTPLGTLPALDDVCNLVGFLCSLSNTGITGQFIAADRGFSYARII